MKKTGRANGGAGLGFAYALKTAAGRRSERSLYSHSGRGSEARQCKPRGWLSAALGTDPRRAPRPVVSTSMRVELGVVLSAQGPGEAATARGAVMRRVRAVGGLGLAKR